MPANLAQEMEPALEYPLCPLCGGTQARTVVEAGDDWVPDGVSRGWRFSVVRCQLCAGCYTSPRFCETSKRLAYLGSYPFFERGRRTSGPPADAEVGAFERRAQLITRICQRPGRILDLGMGDGVFLAWMRQLGWDVTGIDTEPDVITYARNRLGLEACVTADVENDPFPQGPFDVTTMWGLLQLTYRPQQLLEKVRPTLSSNGVIAIGVSNIGSAGAWLFGPHWRGLGLPRHLIHFDPSSLRRLVERSGYEILDLAFETPPWIVAPSVDATLPLPGIAGGVARRCAQTLLSLFGRTRLGDTMILVARAVGA